MRIPIAIVAGALLIAASILIVGRYSIGHVGVGRDSFEVFGVNTLDRQAVHAAGDDELRYPTDRWR
jgi:hypothetical protein